ncbi:MAG: hypothetical protein ACK54I_10820 [Planctomycetota bacterium]|jgi:hypothetical protein
MTKIGLNAKTYRNTGTFAAPVWSELKNVRDLTLTDSMGEADVTRRASGGFREQVPTLRENGIEFDMVNIAGDTDLAAIASNYSARTYFEIAVMDGGITTSGSRGVRMTVGVFKFERSEELENAQMYSVTLKAAPATNPPSDYTVP